ncbi:MAG: hypothetical protein HUJ76_11930 [Parasporobacterium sp.]|nr:hypothetical protein [Parasporobacterium sp.]
MLNTIYELPYGKAFVISDFIQIAEYDTVKQNLKRFTDEDIIQRVLPGIYYKPKYSEILDEYTAVDVNEVAEAMARNYSWNIAPAGDTALNMLGLSTQVPAIYEYVSSGPYREYSIDGTILKFMHRSTKQISDYSRMTMITIQALKALGRDNVTDKHISILKHRLSPNEKKILLEEGRRTTSWVYKRIKEICMEN